MNLDLNPVTKERVQGTVKTIANEIKRCIERWEDMEQWLAALTPDDLNTIGIDATSQAYLGSFRVALGNLVRAYRNQEKVGTDAPQQFIEAFSDPLVF